MLKKLSPKNGQTKLNKVMLAALLAPICANSQALENDYRVNRLSAKELVKRYPYALELSKHDCFKIKRLKKEDVFKDGQPFYTHGECKNKKTGEFSSPKESPPDDVYKLPVNYKLIASGAFSFFWGQPNYCIRNVIIPEGYLSIGNNAFYGCYNLEKVKLPRSLLCMGHLVFAKTKVKEISFPDSMIYLGDKLFEDVKIQSITAPIDFKFYFYKDDWTSLSGSQKKTAIVIDLGEGNLSYLGTFPESLKLKISKPYIHKISDTRSELRMRTVTVGSELWDKYW